MPFERRVLSGHQSSSWRRGQGGSPTWRVALVLLGAAMLDPSATAAANPYAPDEVLVRFRSSSRTRAARDSLHRRMGTKTRRRFAAVGGLELVEVPAGTSVERSVAELAAMPEVLYAEPNYRVEALATPDDPLFPEIWSFDNTGQAAGTPGADIAAPEAWDITTGSSDVVIGVIDTGIDTTHPDLIENLYRNEVECTPNGVDDDANGYVDDCHGINAIADDGNLFDDHAHGTHVAGTIGARGNNGSAVVGVNWEVSLIGCKFLDGSGRGFNSDAIECLEYLSELKDRGVNIVATNNSWSSFGGSRALEEAIEAHAARGILFVAAAGNEGQDAARYPAAYYLPNVMAVAATDRNDQLASFSTFGARTVLLGAPGVEILSLHHAGGTSVFSGTSMAAPHVAGVIGLLQADDPSRDWIELRNLVLAGTDPLPSLSDVTIVGGRLNAFNSLTCSGRTVASRLRPILDAGGGSIDVPVELAMLHIDCAAPNGGTSVTVQPGGLSIALLDDGAGRDQVAGDGIYSATWTPTTPGTYTLLFADSSEVRYEVSGSQLGNPSHRAAGSLLGSAVATDVGRVIAGAPRDSVAGGEVGAAHVYASATGEVLHSLRPAAPSGDEHFGSAVALSGVLALVGAPNADDPFENAGRAYLFDVTTGALLHTFSSPSPAAEGAFGSSVALVGGYPVVGAPYEAVGDRFTHGQGYLFDPSTGSLLHTFENPDPDEAVAMGFSVTALGGNVLFGAPFSPTNAVGGVVFMFDADPSSPTFGTSVRDYSLPLILNTPPNRILPYAVGFAIAAHGNRLVIGDPFGGAESKNGFQTAGLAYVMDTDSGDLLQVLRDPRPNTQLGIGPLDDLFGHVVAIDADHILVGEPQSSKGGTLGSGASYVFDYDGRPQHLLLSPNPGTIDLYGVAVAISPEGFWSGSQREDAAAVDSGTVHLASPRGQDSQKCYKAKRAPGSARFAKSDVQLTDTFEDKLTTVIKPATVCGAATFVNQSVVDPRARLACFKIRNGDSETSSDRVELTVFNSLGVQRIITVKPQHLCLPTATDGGVIPELDAYKCYKAKKAKGEGFDKRELLVTDDLGENNLRVLKVDSFCTPVAVDGGELLAPEVYLTCFKSRNAKGEPKHVATAVAASNGMGSQSLVTKKEASLCVRSQIVPLSPTP